MGVPLSRFRFHHRIPCWRRPYDPRDQARAERDAAIEDRGRRLAERDAVIAERDRCVAERDAAIAEREEVTAERDRRATERDTAAAERDRLRARYSEVANLELPVTPFGLTSEPPAVDDGALVARVIAAYQASTPTLAETSESIWDGLFAEQRHDVHTALTAGDIGAVQGILRDPGRTDLLYGFENIRA